MHSGAFVGQYLGPVFGVPPFTDFHAFLNVDSLPALLLLAVVLAAVIIALWRLVAALRDAVRPGGVSDAGQGWLIAGSLFFGNGLAILFTNNALGVASIRYFLVGWTVTGLILAGLVLTAARRSVVIAGAVLAVWFVFSGMRNLADSMTSINRREVWYPPATVREIVDFARANSATGGYSELAFSRILTFVSDEQLTLLPYNAPPYYEPYVDRLRNGGGREIWIVPFEEEIPDASRNVSDLDTYLKQSSFGNGPLSAELSQDMAGAGVVDRRRIGIYDVWIIE
jgi:hypothetical protein